MVNALKKPNSSSVIEDKHIKSIAQNLDIDAWQVGGIYVDICHVESDFPEWFYIRKETLGIFKFFKDKVEKKFQVLFMGTLGVGKSIMVVLLAFYMALRQKKRVVLFRKILGKGFSMLCLDTENKSYWRMDDANIDELDLNFLRSAKICLDGIQYEGMMRNFCSLGSFVLLATSINYSVKDDDIPVFWDCLVPFWSSLDFNAIGAHFQWREHEINERYFYSGGSLRDFLSEKVFARKSIDEVVGLVDLPVAALSNTLDADRYVRRIDRLRTTEVDTTYKIGLNKYSLSEWCCVITSEYTLRRLGEIVEASYYVRLWFKGRMLGDNGLMRIAFENYVHTMARDGKNIELQVRAYDRAQARQHTYVTLEFKAKSCRNDGLDAAECDAIMKQLSNSSDNYWYPSSRSLVTINSVVKLSMRGQQNFVGLIQITTSDHHKIDSEALDRYAGFYSSSSRYIALVLDKKTCDAFRLSLSEPPTKMPLNVAYITTWARQISTCAKQHVCFIP